MTRGTSKEASQKWQTLVRQFKVLGLTQYKSQPKAYFYYQSNLGYGEEEAYKNFAKQAGLILFKIKKAEDVLQFKQGILPTNVVILNRPQGVTLKQKRTFWQKVKKSFSGFMVNFNSKKK